MLAFITTVSLLLGICCTVYGLIKDLPAFVWVGGFGLGMGVMQGLMLF